MFSFISNRYALKRHERLCDNNDYCNVEMPTLGNKTIQMNLILKEKLFMNLVVTH